MGEIFDANHFHSITNVSRETMDKIQIYANLLVKWQKKINLVSDTTMPHMWRRHFYDSFQLRALLEGAESEKRRILDIGSGAGFPGLLLSLLGVGECHMVESSGKKCAFMGQVIRETGCGAIVHNGRIEDMAAFPVDYIVSRACASLDKLFYLGKNFITDETVCLFLKGQNADQEIIDARKNWAFEVQKHTSRSDGAGVILKASHIKALHKI